MRPLTLQLDFFGPFRHQKINFTKFNDFPVFLISGKTGAGKTTIFDAMCFALFGGTSGGDRQVKQMRSDFATFDELTQVRFDFEHQGQTYRLVRSPEQTVAKKRGTGTHNQPATVTLTVFDASGQAVAEYTKVNAVQTHIRDLLQLTRAQFSQIVLLPQGQFRQFLMANSDEKEKVLRGIFGTSLYGRWAAQLKQQLKQQQQANATTTQTLATYQQQLTWPPEMTGADLAPQAAVTAQLTWQTEQVTKRTALNTALTTAKQTLKQVQQAEATGQALAEKYATQQQLTMEQTQLKQQMPQIEAQRQQVKHLEWAQQLAPVQQQLTAAQGRVQAERTAQTQLIDQQASLKVQQKAAQTTQQQLADQQPIADDRQQRLTTLTAKKGLYEQVEQTTIAVNKAHQQVAHLQEQATELAKRQQQLQQQQTELTALSDQLPSRLTRQATLGNQQRDLTEITQQLTAVTSQQVKLTQAKVVCEQQKNVVTQQTAEATQAETIYRKLDSDWARGQIALLSQRLLPNEPCPVCGSTTHPKPAPSDTLTITEVDVKTAQKQSMQATKTLTTAQTQLINDQQQVKAAQSQLDELTAVLTELIQAKQPTLTTVVAQLAAALTTMQAELTTQQADNQLQVTAAQQAQTQLTQLVPTIDQLTQQQAEVTQVLTAAEKQGLQLQTQLADQQQQLAPDYPTLTALNQYLEQLSQAQTDYETAMQQANQAVTTINEQLAAVQAQLVTTASHLTASQHQVKTATETLTAAMQAAWSHVDFERLNQQLQAVTTLATLRAQINQFEQQLSTLQGRLATVQQAIGKQPQPDLAALALAVTTATAAEQQIEHQYYDLDRELQANQTLVAKMQAALAQARDQQAELAQLAKLADVTNGSGAQKLSLERFVLRTYLQKVLRQANHRLQQLTRGRYQFQLETALGTFRNGSGLEINIYDDNAGKVRSVHTLSGGESFVAALSLALALAEVIQAQAGGIKIEALFIDEGFGSLDEEALEMAMETLQQVEGQSRMIGIISHVSELESQLPAQLQVIPNGNGESKVHYQLAFD
ncbi:SMC family ATPase [Lactobacillus sp. CBA3605]|uniref:AAA family ATPase n=1 Tax=Lactobacillus sp. CBA3605 TaxID=2099788 RepID=UPI000CFC8D5B|nr:SMC family ATPase [Lactobacillus sp. CBA3605]AVK61426.1 SMC family ATPase [Lactobacillus sp. CBA3605]